MHKLSIALYANCLAWFLMPVDSQTYANDNIRVIAASGMPAPGTVLGTNFLSIGGYDFNNSGDVAFNAFINGPGTNGNNFVGIWDYVDGVTNLVVRDGSQAPGLSDSILFDGLGRQVINDLGQTAFYARIAGSGVGFATEGIWVQTESGLELFVRSLDPVIGIEDGYEFGGIFEEQLDYVQNRLVIGSNLGFNGAGSFRSVGMLDDDGNFDVVVKENDQAPGLPDGNRFSQFNYNGSGLIPLVFNQDGFTAFTARVTSSTPGNFTSGIFSNHNGQLELIVQQGDLAPGLGEATFTEFFGSNVQLNSSGEIAFLANVEGNNLRAGANSSAIFTDIGGNQLRLVAQNKDPAPGLHDGVQFASLGNPILGERGKVYFNAVLEGGGFEISDLISGLWVSEFGQEPELIFKTGDPAPDMPPGVTLATVKSPVFNNRGQYLIEFVLDGSAISETNDKGIWAYSLGDGLKRIIQEGDSIDVNDDPLVEDLRTIDRFGFGDLGPKINDQGEILFHATFTDGTSGIFVSKAVAIPEPSSAMLFFIAFVGYAGYIRRRHFSTFLEIVS